MKKLTKKQQEIESLAKRLNKPSESFHKWDLRLRAEHEFTDACMVYESFFSTMGKYSVERTFEVGKDYTNEVAQWWLDTETGVTYYREKKAYLYYGGNYGYRFSGYFNDTPFEFKRKSSMVDQYGYRFIRPYQKGKAGITKVLEMRGATQEDIDKWGIDKMSRVLADARMETILKHSVKDFYWFMKSCRKVTDAIWSAYKITIRHNYRIRNIDMWYDLVSNLEYLGMDWHNPKFVCAKAYKRLHDELDVRADIKRTRERRKADEEAKRKRIEQSKAIVEERMSKYADLCICNGELHAVVMITYDDYYEEGQRMHHCVGGYFDRQSSLILSMRNNEGKRVETVEVSLDSFEVVQSRGLQNHFTRHHKEIVDLVNDNMWQIRERALRIAC